MLCCVRKGLQWCNTAVVGKASSPQRVGAVGSPPQHIWAWSREECAQRCGEEESSGSRQLMSHAAQTAARNNWARKQTPLKKRRKSCACDLQTQKKSNKTQPSVSHWILLNIFFLGGGGWITTGNAPSVFKLKIESVWECRWGTLNGRAVSVSPQLHRPNTANTRGDVSHRVLVFNPTTCSPQNVKKIYLCGSLGKRLVAFGHRWTAPFSRKLWGICIVDHTVVTLVFIWSQEHKAPGCIKLSDSPEKLQTKWNVTALSSQKNFVFSMPLRSF